MFCADDIPIHAVLLFNCLHAAAGDMFSKGRYSEQGEKVIGSLTLFGVKKSIVKKIIEDVIVFIRIRTEELLQRFMLERITIDKAA